MSNSPMFHDPWTRNMVIRVSPWAVSFCAALALTACGGGDGSTTASPGTPLTCTAPQVPNAEGTTCVDQVVSPANAQVVDVKTMPSSPNYGELFALTVTGKGLPDALSVTMPGCTFAAEAGGSSTSRSYFCTPRKTGVLAGTVAAIGAGAALKSFEVIVHEPKQTLNDTGADPSSCYAAGAGALIACGSASAIALSDQQDGMTGLDATNGSNSDGKLGFRYTKLAIDGSELPANADTWMCVKDNVTSLVWEVKTPSNVGNGYSYSDAQTYRDMVNGAGLCGAKDWRLPSVQELMSLKDYGVGDAGIPRVDTNWLGETSPGGYWSSTQDVANPGNSQWYVDFGSTSTGTDPLSIGYAVRLVRGFVPAPAIRYTPLFDGSEIRDNLTGMVWRRCPEGMAWNQVTCTGKPIRFTHGEALAHAKAQTAVARANQEVGWRLPNVKELFSMSDTGKASPAVDTVAFPGDLNQGGWNYWSSTPLARTEDVVMTVRFDNGGAEAKLRGDASGSSSNKTVALRLVRYFP